MLTVRDLITDFKTKVMAPPDDDSTIPDDVVKWNSQFRKSVRFITSGIHISSSVSVGLEAKNPLTIGASAVNISGLKKERNISDDWFDSRSRNIPYGDQLAYLKNIEESQIIEIWNTYRSNVINVTLPLFEKMMGKDIMGEYMETQLKKIGEQAVPYNLALKTPNKLFSKPPLIEEAAHKKTKLLGKLVAPFKRAMPEIFPSKRDVPSMLSDSLLVTNMLVSGGDDLEGDAIGIPAYKQAGLPFPASARDLAASARAYGLHLLLARRLLVDGKFRKIYSELEPELIGGLLGRRDSNNYGKSSPVIEFNGTEIIYRGGSSILTAPRDIVMMGKNYKAILGPVYQTGLNKQLKTPYFDLRFESLTKRIKKGGVYIASDYSSYDKTMAQDLIDAINDVTFEDFPELKSVAKMETGAVTVFRNGDVGMYLPYLANNSGNSGTTYKNNVANLLSTFVVVGRLLGFGDALEMGDESAYQLFMKVKDWYSRTSSVSTILGDDAFHAFYDKRISPDAYIETLGSLGWKVKIEPQSFLKKSILFRGSATVAVPQLFTTLSNRFSGEKSKSHIVPVVLGAANLMTVFEFTGVKPTPSQVNMLFDPVTKLVNLQVGTSFRDFTHLVNYSESAEFMKAVLSYSSKKDNVPLLNELIRNMTQGTFNVTLSTGSLGTDKILKSLSTSMRPITTSMYNDISRAAQLESTSFKKIATLSDLRLFILNYHHQKK